MQTIVKARILASMITKPKLYTWTELTLELQCGTPFVTRKEMKWNGRIIHGYADIVPLPSPNNFYSRNYL